LRDETHRKRTRLAALSPPAMLPSALSSSSLQCIAPQPPTTAHRAGISSSAPSDGRSAWSARTTSSARTRRDSRKAREPTAPGRKRREINQHRVSCSMVDRMDMPDSAQRVTSPRSQRSARSTDDSHQLSMSEIGRVLCVQRFRRQLHRVSLRVKAVVLTFFCLCDLERGFFFCCEARASRFQVLCAPNGASACGATDELGRRGAPRVCACRVPAAGSVLASGAGL
jgi:hypothetical protein